MNKSPQCPVVMYSNAGVGTERLPVIVQAGPGAALSSWAQSPLTGILTAVDLASWTALLCSWEFLGPPQLAAKQHFSYCAEELRTEDQREEQVTAKHFPC